MLHTIEEAIKDIQAGKVIIVVDDEDRENEGDIVTAARNVTPEVINFMSTQGRGLICAAITEKRCEELQLQPMVMDNTSNCSSFHSGCRYWYSSAACNRFCIFLLPTLSSGWPNFVEVLVFTSKKCSLFALLAIMSTSQCLNRQLRSMIV